MNEINIAELGRTIENVPVEHCDFDRFHTDIDHPRRTK